jgi:hypothetical protein
MQLTQSQWLDAVGRSKQPPEGYIAIEGQYFAVGDKARRYITAKNRPQGAARYVPEYYGVGMAMAISEAFESGTRVINLFASHAPRDIGYADDIVKAVQGNWHFVTHRGDYKIDIKSVETFDECLGGFNHAVLTTRGTPLKNNPYRNKTVLVLDVGGYTTDIIAVDPNGMIDDSSLDSTILGVTDVMTRFEKELRTKFRDEFKSVGDIDIHRLETAILSGKFPYGKKALACQDIAQASLNTLVNDVIDIINRMGGAANYDVILLTGGGSALIYDTLKKAFPAIDFVLVEKERELMRFSNVMGAAKMFKMLELLGIL